MRTNSPHGDIRRCQENILIICMESRDILIRVIKYYALAPTKLDLIVAWYDYLSTTPLIISYHII